MTDVVPLDVLRDGVHEVKAAEFSLGRRGSNVPLDEFTDSARDRHVVRAQFLREHGERGDHRFGVYRQIFERVGVVGARLVGFSAHVNNLSLIVRSRPCVCVCVLTTS